MATKKIRVYELARELGVENAVVLDLANELKIGVKSHSSSIDDPSADRVRRLADSEGLRQEPTVDEPERTEPERAPARVVSAGGRARAPEPSPEPPRAPDPPAPSSPAPVADLEPRTRRRPRAGRHPRGAAPGSPRPRRRAGRRAAPGRPLHRWPTRGAAPVRSDACGRRAPDGRCRVLDLDTPESCAAGPICRA